MNRTRKRNTPPGEAVRVGRVWAVRGNVAFVLAREGLPGPSRPLPSFALRAPCLRGHNLTP